jgi:hypothetical protein
MNPKRAVAAVVGAAVVLASTACHRVSSGDPTKATGAGKASVADARKPGAADLQRNACCHQCLDAASQDAAGFDISSIPCHTYADARFKARALSGRCKVALESESLTVSACREFTRLYREQRTHHSL